MTVDRLPRKLVAILYADVVGYSRLTGEDEDATHRRLAEYLDLISTAVARHRGQIMHYAGDAVLATYGAAVDAVASAVDIQQQLRRRNDDLPTERRVEFRIGVNLGDVIEDRGDVYGDGVNVAARLESLASPGGISISEAVHTAVGTKLPLCYRFAGDQRVKNIERPVRAYHIDATAMTEETGASRATRELTDKPSIAVLPFTNMSGDAEQEYFSDGISEDIITGLSRFHYAMPRFPGGWRYVVSSLGHLGRLDEAHTATSQLLQATPGESLQVVRKVLPNDRSERMERLIAGLRKAGVPEGDA